MDIISAYIGLSKVYNYMNVLADYAGFFCILSLNCKSVSSAVPLFKSSFGRRGDIGSVAIWEQNSLCLLFILNWEKDKHKKTETQTLYNNMEMVDLIFPALTILHDIILLSWTFFFY